MNEVAAKQAKYVLAQKEKGRKRVRFPVHHEMPDFVETHFAPLYPGRLQNMRFFAVSQLAALRLLEGVIPSSCFTEAVLAGFGNSKPAIMNGWRSRWALEANKGIARDLGAETAISIAGHARDGAVVEGFLVGAYARALAGNNVPFADAKTFVEIMKDHETCQSAFKNYLPVKAAGEIRVPAGSANSTPSRPKAIQPQMSLSFG